MTAATEFPKPTAKERKYDRQLRLWAASGQAALESANVLLVNTSTGTVGVETLKNLVLPGELDLPIDSTSHPNNYQNRCRKVYNR